VDAVVISTDKNFMVPVGGGAVISKNKQFIQKISNLYPGRASITAALDIFITFLSIGEDG